MIRLEAAEDGFAVILDGHRALIHSARAPLFELGGAEPAIRQHKGGFSIRQKGFKRTKAKAWKQLEARDDFISVDFEGLARASIREEAGALHISLSAVSSRLQ